jgi:Mannosyl-glycoprotein endo-beta-N-acetylglucosaminidase
MIKYSTIYQNRWVLQISIGCILLFAAKFPLAGEVAAQSLANLPNMNDPCYGPTQDLSLDLRRAFVAEISELARKAERDHHVPAAIFAAMSINESGYGTTRLSRDTNNIMSFKWTSDKGPDGRKIYRLTCQPSEDRENRYVTFESRSVAADFVAQRLEQSKYYRAATRKYWADVSACKDRMASGITWFKAIAPAYNPYKTDAYIREVMKAAADPVGLSGKTDPNANLWRLKP